MTALDPFMLYFPYILLIMALVLVFIERGFVKAFKTGMKLDTFYNLLVKEDEKKDESERANHVVLDLEDSRSAIEVSHSFSDKSNYFLSYVVRTVAEFMVSVALFTWLAYSGVQGIKSDQFILCDVYGAYYECAGHPQQFYMYILMAALVILFQYILCSIYNLLWLSFSGLGTLSRVMRKYRQRLIRSKPSGSDKEILGDLWGIYYNNRDLKLLLNLLAESSGIAPSLRIMALFDRNLRCRIEPSNVRLSQVNVHERSSVHEVNTEGGIVSNPAKRTLYDVDVEFQEAEAIREIFAHIPNVTYLYTVEIQPPTEKSSVKSVQIGDDGSPDFGLSFNYRFGGGDQTDAPQGDQLEMLEKGATLHVPLHDLETCKDYVIRVCTIVNGRTIARYIRRIKKQE